jgi:hypothetical protein
MRFEGKELRNQFEAAFGIKADELTAPQLWFLTKFAKHVRLRCRNNAAFNNYMNASFAPAKFRQVTKTRADGSSYPGLEITDFLQSSVAGGDDE